MIGFLDGHTWASNNAPKAIEEMPMTKDLSMLDQALDEAHLPSLLVALTHITGNTAHLRDDLRPFYDFFSDSRTGGLSEDKQVELKAFAKKVITDYFTKSEKLLPQPSSADMRKMMDFLVAAPIPEHYVPFLMEELALEGRDMKHPHWDTPALKAASRKMHVVIVGAGMSGILIGDPAAAGGHFRSRSSRRMPMSAALGSKTPIPVAASTRRTISIPIPSSRITTGRSIIQRKPCC